MMLYLVHFVLIRRRSSSSPCAAITIQSVQMNGCTRLGTHTDCLSTSLGIFQEISQFLFEDVQPLRTRSIGHAKHGAPQVEGIGHIGANADEDEENEVDGVS